MACVIQKERRGQSLTLLELRTKLPRLIVDVRIDSDLGPWLPRWFTLDWQMSVDDDYS